jgi:hypothetical protein
MFVNRIAPICKGIYNQSFSNPLLKTTRRIKSGNPPLKVQEFLGMAMWRGRRKIHSFDALLDKESDLIKYCIEEDPYLKGWVAQKLSISIFTIPGG